MSIFTVHIMIVGWDQPWKPTMLFAHKMNFIIDSLRKTSCVINNTVICKRTQKGESQIKSLHHKLLNLHLSCRFLCRTTGQAISYFLMNTSFLTANLTVEAWLLPFTINIFKNCLPQYIFKWIRFWSAANRAQN
jgi:hypothetical protein